MAQCILNLRARKSRFLTRQNEASFCSETAGFIGGIKLVRLSENAVSTCHVFVTDMSSFISAYPGHHGRERIRSAGDVRCGVEGKTVTRGPRNCSAGSKAKRAPDTDARSKLGQYSRRKPTPARPRLPVRSMKRPYLHHSPWRIAVRLCECRCHP
jgi:hypothetical protein